MSEITRYSILPARIVEDDGDYVLFTDHEAAIALKDGTIAADDERLVKAAEKAGITYMGCDTADWLAETVVELRAELKMQDRIDVFTQEEFHARNGKIKSLTAALAACRSEWIPVSDRFPEPGVKVIAYYKNYLEKDRRIMAFYAPRFTVEAIDEDEDNGADEYCEEEDRYYFTEGWYEENEFDEVHWKVEGNVTHWMQLPKVPIAAAALKEAKPKPSILDHEDISGDNLLGG